MRRRQKPFSLKSRFAMTFRSKVSFKDSVCAALLPPSRKRIDTCSIALWKIAQRQTWGAWAVGRRVTPAAAQQEDDEHQSTYLKYEAK